MRDADVPMAHFMPPEGDGARAFRLAVGVVSIVVAAIGALVGLLGSVGWIEELSTLGDNAPAITLNTPNVTAPPATAAAPVDADDAAAIADGLTQLHPLTADERSRLIDALPRVGVPFLSRTTGGAFEPDVIAAGVTGIWITPDGQEDGPYLEFAFETGTIDLTVDGVALYDYRDTAQQPWYSATVAEDGTVEYDDSSVDPYAYTPPTADSSSATWGRAALLTELAGVALCGLLLLGGILALKPAGAAVWVLRVWSILQLIFVVAMLTITIGWIRSFGTMSYDPDLAVEEAVGPVLFAYIGAILPTALLIALAITPARNALRPAE